MISNPLYRGLERGLKTKNNLNLYNALGFSPKLACPAPDTFSSVTNQRLNSSLWCGVFDIITLYIWASQVAQTVCFLRFMICFYVPQQLYKCCFYLIL